jgi:hypothetical protein
MSRLAAALAVLAAFPLAAAAAPPEAEGRIDSDEARVEILGRPVRVGERIDLPEGWFRVEEQGTEDENVGSFSVVPAETFAQAGVPLPGADEAPSAEDPGVSRRTHECRAERAAYLAELWRTSGIEVKDPDALIEGLEGKGQGANLGFYWFALATDPFRPLAWSSSLRGKADALARCVHGG